MKSVPPFIFFRPGFVRYRWDAAGDLAKTLPEDKISLFHHALRRLESDVAADIVSPSPLKFPASAIAMYHSATEIQGDPRDPAEAPPFSDPALCLSEEFSSIFQTGYISSSFRDGLLYFTLSQCSGDTLKSQCRRNELILARSKLISMLMSSLPDPYTEPLWELLSRHCREVVRTTVIPFFNIFKLEDLMLAGFFDDMYD
jgi:hypothetical protein